MDLTDRKFGRLRVLARGSRSTAQHTYWLCRCRCRCEKQVRNHSLTSGAVRSCGCLWRSVMSRRGIRQRPGQRFGRLRVVRQVGTVKKRGRVYLCRCDCGKNLRVQGRHLRSGEAQSCGCLYRDTRSKQIANSIARAAFSWGVPQRGARRGAAERGCAGRCLTGEWALP